MYIEMGQVWGAVSSIFIGESTWPSISRLRLYNVASNPFAPPPNFAYIGFNLLT